MALWTAFGLGRGQATTSWPRRGGAEAAGQAGVETLPRLDPAKCTDGCSRCAEVCLPQAITLAGADEKMRLNLDLGRCIGCRLCIEACPSGAFTASTSFEYAVRGRDALRRQPIQDQTAGEAAARADVVRRRFRGSLHIRHLDAGSCN
ncbi:MAG: 4Fe-4S dicluster domain-containing protein, partial [Gammaproteobacteria bacterium]|nr:4Fe-4S dicluster domain-containing protein [Gammaproteobacteria bacterium]